MSAKTIVIGGLVHPDGTLELAGAAGLPPGMVEVTLRPISVEVPGGDWWEVLQTLRAEVATRGHSQPAVEEIDGEINAMRDEWEQHQLEIERMQEGFQRTDEPRSAAERLE